MRPGVLVGCILALLSGPGLAQECRVQVTHNRKCQLRYRRLVGNPAWVEIEVPSKDVLRSEIILPCEAVELEATDSTSWLFFYAARKQVRADPGAVQLVLEPRLRAQVPMLGILVLAGCGFHSMRQRQKARESVLSRKLEQSHQDLSQREIRDSLAWEFAHGMAENSSSSALCEYAVGFLRKQMGYDGAAVVDCRSNRPQLLVRDSPAELRLEEAAMQCFRSQRPIWLMGRKISPAHPFSLLFPLGKFGVLYAGRARAQHLEEAENLLVGAVAIQLRLGLQISQSFQENQERLVNLMEASKSTAVGQLAAGLAHELNSPLGAISLLIERARVAGKDPERLEAQLSRANQSVDKAKGIISRLLFYSREGARHGEHIDLNQVIQDTVEFLRNEFCQSKIDLRVILQPLPHLGGNAHDLQQCLVNLLMNAQAAAAGGVVEVQSCYAKETIRILVSDDGVGIPEDVQARIFEPFFTTRPVGKGVGLGLCVARRIAETHGGRLFLEHSTTSGSRFVLELPVTSVKRQAK